MADPGLGGPRVRLRPWAPADAGALAAAWADDQIVAHTRVPPEPTVATAATWIAGWAVRADRGLALDLVVTGSGPDGGDEVWGEVGLGPIDWTRRAAEVGYWVAAGRRGGGVASEAVGLLTDWALGTLPLQVLVARVPPDHRASWRVLERAGFERRRALQSGSDLWARAAADTASGDIRTR